jgi:hypothetical protein
MSVCSLTKRRNRRGPLFAAVLLAAICALPAPRAQARAPGCVSQALADYASVHFLERPKLPAADQDLWQRYKSDARFAAWIDTRAAKEGLADYDALLASSSGKNSSSEARGRSLSDAQKIKSWTREYDRLTAEERARIRTEPHTVDLLDPCGDQLCKTTVFRPNARLPGGYADLEFNLYQKKILHLREGDIVRARDLDGKVREWVLGKFLGAGNATHVWEIQGSQDRVLRIPFLAANKFGVGMRKTPTLERTREFMRNLRDPPHIPGLRRVQVHLIGELNEVAEVDRIHGSTTGDVFLSRNEAFINTLRTERRTKGRFDIRELASRHGLSKDQARRLVEQHDKLERALGLIEAAKRGRARGLVDPRLIDVEPFQLVWDENLSEWILADW